MSREECAGRTWRTDVFPTECVLCDYSGETHEEHEAHMEEVHEL